jgi:hypothetical protein
VRHNGATTEQQVTVLQIIVETKPPQPDPETGIPVATPPEALHASVAASQQWGVYSGSDIFRLVAWLRAGSMAAEEQLRRTLEQAPVPLPPEDTVILPGKWQVRPGSHSHITLN